MSFGFRIGSYAQDVLAKLKRGMTAAGLAKYDTFDFPLGTALQVTAGHTLYITKIRFVCTAANGNTQIGYGDDAVSDAAGAPTNWVVVSNPIYHPTANETIEKDVWIPIPAGKYPAISNGPATGYCEFEGVEIID